MSRTLRRLTYRMLYLFSLLALFALLFTPKAHCLAFINQPISSFLNKPLHGRRNGSALRSKVINYRQNVAITASTDHSMFEQISNTREAKLRWNNESQTFVLARTHQSAGLLARLRNSLLPESEVSVDYFRYSKFRVLQRFFSSIATVFGTQSLLLALGMKKENSGLAAGTVWVLKDAIGKVSRILWASENGRKFDHDAKKWRFRSSILFALGNALEMLTLVIPSSFLVSAAVGNAAKQTAMLTSSSTRSAIYKSFTKGADNIGDITAKGEAQTAVVDIIGTIAGVLLSKLIYMSSKPLMVFMLVAFAVVDILCVYKEVKSLVFSTLNFERLGIVLRKLFDSEEKAVVAAINAGAGASAAAAGSDVKQMEHLKDILSPWAISHSENVFLPARFGTTLFKVWTDLSDAETRLMSQTACWHEEKTQEQQQQQQKKGEGKEEEEKERDRHELGSRGPINRKEDKVAVVASARPAPWYSRIRVLRQLAGVVTIYIPTKRGRNGNSAIYYTSPLTGQSMMLSPGVLLRKDASGRDVLQGLIAVNRLSYNLEQRRNNNFQFCGKTEKGEKPALSEADFVECMLRKSVDYTNKHLDRIIELLCACGWDTNKYAFGTVSKRVEWPHDSLLEDGKDDRTFKSNDSGK